ncbi:hypothetical protein EQG49_11950 [Periweissella cryptocerci]|uniref:RNase H type-1 domain-containing protein n=1 Tax=Periweissella cryptocerci TaxID=2506420 RepID=A0A4P6YWF0_9LACO|nr:RNase H family protein [Periweissella cryptocerci]QBO37116.1 hypothetical protein EQG49_11950 [Periweissella cryptocerci]
MVTKKKHWMAIFNGTHEGIFERNELPTPSNAWIVGRSFATQVSFDTKKEAQLWLDKQITTYVKSANFKSNIKRDAAGHAVVNETKSQPIKETASPMIADVNELTVRDKKKRNNFKQFMHKATTLLHSLRPSVRIANAKELQIKSQPFVADLAQAEAIPSPNPNTIFLITDGKGSNGDSSEKGIGILGYMLMDGIARDVEITASYEPNSTTQELLAIIAGLNAIPVNKRHKNLTICTDRLDFITRVNTFQLDDWYNTSPRPNITNKELWAELYELLQLFSSVRWMKVTSHENPRNKFVHDNLNKYATLLRSGERIIAK